MISKQTVKNVGSPSREKPMKRKVQRAISLSLSTIAAIAPSLPALAQLPTLRTPVVTPRQTPRGNVPATVAPGTAPAALPSKGASSSVPEAGYTLGGGDRVAVEVLGVPEFSKEYLVLIDGSLNLPVIGTVSVQGLTLRQASAAITARYAPYVTSPVVTVTLINPRPFNVAIAGEITHPGSYKLPANKDGVLQFPTLIDVIQLAKGVTQGADVRNIQIRRPQRSGSEQILNVNLQNFLETANLDQDLTLRDGDRIYIPTATAVNTEEVRQRANANFSADLTQPIGVVIVGEVNRPGPYTVFASDVRSANQKTELGFVSIDQQRGTLVGLPTVTRAIKIAGGITLEADIRQVQIRRRPKTGPEQIININLWELLQKGDISQDVLLQEGDSIIVPTAQNIDVAEVSQLAATSFSPNAIKINVVGEVLRPGSVEVAPNTSLHQALLATGSFNQVRAKKNQVELLRLNPNGTVSRRSIEVDFSQGLNPDNNPTLRNNDVIIVARSGLTRLGDQLTTILQPVTGVLGLINGVTGMFTGVETTINTFQRLFLGGDLQRRLQLQQYREQRQDRQRQIDIQNQQLELQQQLQQIQLQQQLQQLQNQQQNSQQQNSQQQNSQQQNSQQTSQ
ncbi:MAG: polysaccharide biosynthesis/export family protein [Actinomycetota bacterium]